MSTAPKPDILGAPSLGGGLQGRDPAREHPGCHGGLAVEAQGRILSFPYVAQIRSLIADGRITAARALLEVALAWDRNDAALAALRELLAPPRVTRSPTRGVDRSAEFHWLKEHWRDYRGQWVAVSGNDLVAQADSLKELLTALKPAHPERRPLIHRVDE